MGMHPIHLAVRFLLEITALISVGMWGWKQSEGWLQYILAIGIPILIAVIWGTFAVPNDPSRSGKAPVVTPGAIRLTIELGVFAYATWSLYDMEYTTSSATMGVSVALHYIMSYDRILWLLSK